MQRNTDSNFIDNEGTNLKKRTDQIQVEPRSSKAHTQGKKLTKINNYLRMSLTEIFPN